MQTQYSLLGYRIDLYFHDYKLAIEIDEFGHCYRNIDYEMKRQRSIEEELGCEFNRVNTDEKYFNIFVEIGKIIEESTKGSIIDDVKKLLKAASKLSNNGTISKVRKNFARHLLLTI